MRENDALEKPQSTIEGRVMYGAADSVDQVKDGLKNILNLK